MTELASLANCQGWLSIDSDNYDSGILAYVQKPGVWKLALLQEANDEINEKLLPELALVAKSKQVVSFPAHHGGRHAEPIQHDTLFTCPAVMGLYKLESNARKLRPCQSCTFCLP